MDQYGRNSGLESTNLSGRDSSGAGLVLRTLSASGQDDAVSNMADGQASPTIADVRHPDARVSSRVAGGRPTDDEEDVDDDGVVGTRTNDGSLNDGDDDFDQSRDNSKCIMTDRSDDSAGRDVDPCPGGRAGAERELVAEPPRQLALNSDNLNTFSKSIENGSVPLRVDTINDGRQVYRSKNLDPSASVVTNFRQPSSVGDLASQPSNFLVPPSQTPGDPKNLSIGSLEPFLAGSAHARGPSSKSRGAYSNNNTNNNNNNNNSMVAGGRSNDTSSLNGNRRSNNNNNNSVQSGKYYTGAHSIATAASNTGDAAVNPLTDPLNSENLLLHMQELRSGHPAPLQPENLSTQVPARQGLARAASMDVEASETMGSVSFAPTSRRTLREGGESGQQPSASSSVRHDGGDPYGLAEERWSVASTGLDRDLSMLRDDDIQQIGLSKASLQQLRHQLESGSTPLRPELLAGLGDVMRAIARPAGPHSDKSLSMAVEVPAEELPAGRADGSGGLNDFGGSVSNADPHSPLPRRADSSPPGASGTIGAGTLSGDASAGSPVAVDPLLSGAHDDVTEALSQGSTQAENTVSLSPTARATKGGRSNTIPGVSSGAIPGNGNSADLLRRHRQAHLGGGSAPDDRDDDRDVDDDDDVDVDDDVDAVAGGRDDDDVDVYDDDDPNAASGMFPKHDQDSRDGDHAESTYMTEDMNDDDERVDPTIRKRLLELVRLFTDNQREQSRVRHQLSAAQMAAEVRNMEVLAEIKAFQCEMLEQMSALLREVREDRRRAQNGPATPGGSAVSGSVNNAAAVFGGSGSAAPPSTACAVSQRSSSAVQQQQQPVVGPGTNPPVVRLSVKYERPPVAPAATSDNTATSSSPDATASDNLSFVLPISPHVTVGEAKWRLMERLAQLRVLPRSETELSDQYLLLHNTEVLFDDDVLGEALGFGFHSVGVGGAMDGAGDHTASDGYRRPMLSATYALILRKTVAPSSSS